MEKRKPLVDRSDVQIRIISEVMDNAGPDKDLINRFSWRNPDYYDLSGLGLAIFKATYQSS
ncbi:MAG: hypothetical protein HRU41_10900 [Saprospiraceae bacterium]|nr:hypothetical protein [Saprospiraceae bacterium]